MINCASACSHTSACCLAAARVFAPATRIVKRLQRARYAHGSEAANESRDLHNRNAVPLHLAHSTSSAAPVATAACISHVSLRYSQAGKSRLLTCSTGNHPSQRTLAVSWQSSRERSPSRSTWCVACVTRAEEALAANARSNSRARPHTTACDGGFVRSRWRSAVASPLASLPNALMLELLVTTAAQGSRS